MVSSSEFRHAGEMLLLVADKLDEGMDFGDALDLAKQTFGRFKLHNKKSFLHIKKVLF